MAAVNRNKVTTTSPVGVSVGATGSGYGLSVNSNYRVRGWQPTVLYLIALVVVEMFAYCAMRYAFRSVHGG